jgi:hypothetical protein
MPGIQLQYIDIRPNGVFASMDIPPSTNLGPGFLKIKKTGDPTKDYVETKLGKLISNSQTPNLFFKTVLWKYYLITNRLIYKGEELTLNHSLLPWKRQKRKPVKIDSSKNPIAIWKKEMNLTSISKEDFPIDWIKRYYFLEKIDGELNCLMYERDSDISFITRSDMMRTDLLVLDEYKNILDRSNFSSIVIMGEGTAIRNGVILPFNQIQSILKTAYKNSENDNMYHHHPFDIFSINGKRYTGNWESRVNIIRNLFKGSKRIHPIRYIKGDLNRAWDRFLTTFGVEGLVARNGKNFKIKKSFSFDLAIVAVGNTNMKSWSRGQISYLKVAFMNEPGEFILATNIGTGFTTKFREDLFNWAQKNKIEEKNNEIWVKPTTVVETRWLRIRNTNMPTYKYIPGRGYKYIGDKFGYSLMQSSLIGLRNDKKVSVFDIGFRQIPIDLR